MDDLLALADEAENSGVSAVGPSALDVPPLPAKADDTCNGNDLLNSLVDEATADEVKGTPQKGPAPLRFYDGSQSAATPNEDVLADRTNTFSTGLRMKQSDSDGGFMGLAKKRKLSEAPVNGMIERHTGLRVNPSPLPTRHSQFSHLILSCSLGACWQPRIWN